MADLIERRPWTVALLLALAAEALFLLRLPVPHQMVFDETHYVPAARAWAHLATLANAEHPPLAKQLMAIGIRLFGDTPFGWRVMSTLAGSATIASVFAIVRLTTGRSRPALVAALLALLNFTIYVQARIAMLDTFMAAFLIGGIAAAAWTLRRGGWWRWTLAAMLLGAATACKWAAAPYVAFAGVAFLIAKRADVRHFPGLRALPALALLGVVSVAVYFATFLPMLLLATGAPTLAGLVPLQIEMYHRQTQVLPAHTYQSRWWTWPLMVRPIWYLYEHADGAQRGILMIGNPAVMWGGLVAVAASLGGWVRGGSMRLLAALLLWFASLAVFALIPKSLGFYYYYYPSGIFLCVAIGAALDHWRARVGRWDTVAVALAALAAGWFLPVLTAAALPDPGAFRHWTWFTTWV